MIRSHERAKMWVRAYTEMLKPWPDFQSPLRLESGVAQRCPLEELNLDSEERMRLSRGARRAS